MDHDQEEVTKDGLEVVILMGLQASGKSTFRRLHFDATHVVVSKDLMRNQRQRQKRQMEQIESALRAGRPVVVDNTNPRQEDRVPLIEMARHFGARVRGYYFSSTFEACMARNAARPGRERVPDVGLRATAKVLRRPSYAEGFDELHFVRMAPGARFIVEPFEEGGSR